MNWIRHLVSRLSTSSNVERDPIASADSISAGLEKARTGDWSNAVQHFRDAARLDPRSAEAQHNLSIAHSNLGDHEPAYAAAKLAADLSPDSATLLMNLGNAALRVEQPDEAEKAFKRALVLEPDSSAIHANLGIMYCQEKEWTSAIEHLERADELGQPNVSVLIPLTVAYRSNNQLDQAETAIDRALTIHPTSIDGLLERVRILQKRFNWTEAMAVANKIIALETDNFEAQYLLAITLQNLDKTSQALEILETLLERHPHHYSATNHKAIILRKSNREKQALEVLHKFQAAVPDDAGSYFLLGHHFHEVADFAEALKYYDKACQISPKHPEILKSLGRAHYELRNYDEARTYLEKALSVSPNDGTTIRQLGELDLATGKLASGWDLMSDRRTSNIREILRWIDDDNDHYSASISGKSVLIMREQGLGDEIRWSSCYRDVISESKHCTIQCDQRLAPILKRSLAEAEIFPAEPKNSPQVLPAEDSYEIKLLAGDLPARFRRKIQDFPDRKSFLVVDPQKASLWKNRLDELGGNLKIGICWRSDVVDWYRMRTAFYTHIDEWEGILTVPGATFINLHYGNYAYELEQAKELFGVPIHTWPDLDLRDDLDSVFALISELDLVITVQTAVWNMAGAVGTETWAVLHPIMYLGTDHVPWYKSVKPVKHNLGDSSEIVLGRIAAQLRQRIAEQR